MKTSPIAKGFLHNPLVVMVRHVPVASCCVTKIIQFDPIYKKITLEAIKDRR